MAKTRVKIKPLSVNRAWKGRRFKSADYKMFEIEFSQLLKKINIEIPEPKFEIYFKFGLSNLLSDGDNCIKQSQDLIAKRYKFNDKLIKRWVVDVEDVKKGEEFIEFEIKHLLND